MHMYVCMSVCLIVCISVCTNLSFIYYPYSINISIAKPYIHIHRDTFKYSVKHCKVRNNYKNKVCLYVTKVLASLRTDMILLYNEASPKRVISIFGEGFKNQRMY